MILPLNFKVFGSGDPIIILHGFMGSLDNWQSFAKQLAEDYMVITVDLRNHGKSPHDHGFSYELMAEDLKALMESEWIHNAVIMGHSMGGKVAMKFAMMYPDMVEKLIVVDIAPKLYPRGHDDVLEAMNAISIGDLKDRKEAEAILAKTLDDQGIRLFLMKNLKRQGEGYIWKVNLPVVTERYEAILQAIDGDPFDDLTLFVRGANSKYVLDSDMDYIKVLFPEAQLSTIEEAGHWIHAERPEELMEIVKTFLNS